VKRILHCAERFLRPITLRGEEVVIARHGKPLVRLVPVRSAGTRPIGLRAGALSEEEAAESLRPLAEEEAEGWYGG
jgi:antitoxin (DNA-binding transcriptional repressor) of toxin-antitoxin stability system